MKGTWKLLGICAVLCGVLCGCGMGEQLPGFPVAGGGDSGESPSFAAGEIPRVYLNTVQDADLISSVLANLAAGKPVEVSSSETADFPGSNLVDCNNQTRWASGLSDDEFFVIDLGMEQSFGCVALRWENAYAKRYVISASSDGENWTELVRQDSGSGGTEVLDFEPVTARYVKWQGLERATEYGYSLYEVLVCTDKDTAVDSGALYMTEPTKSYQYIKLAIVDKAGGEHKPIIEDNAILRVRGNYTSLAAKKPYNFKLSSKTNVLGLGENKKWGLLANHYDKTLLRNKLASDFAVDLGLPTQLHSTFVDVYLDGVYQGNYLLTELPTDNTTKTKVARGEFVFERSQDSLIERRFYSPVYNLRFEMKSPDYDEVTPEQLQLVTDFLGRAEEAMLSGDEGAISALVDLDSFAGVFVAQQLFKDVDDTLDSDYFYIKGQKLYAGPIWDQDIAMGNVSEVYDREEFHNYLRYYNRVDQTGQVYGTGSGDSIDGWWLVEGWFKTLLQYDFFRQMVQDKFAAVQGAFENIYAPGGSIDQLLDEFGGSFERNYTEAGWSLTEPASVAERQQPEDTFRANVEFLRTWLERRGQWVFSNDLP